MPSPRLFGISAHSHVIIADEVACEENRSSTAALGLGAERPGRHRDWLRRRNSRTGSSGCRSRLRYDMFNFSCTLEVADRYIPIAQFNGRLDPC